MSVAKKDFLLIVGSQRCGTTLLHWLLGSCSDYVFHPVKELHYFDTLYNIITPENRKSRAAKRCETVLKKREQQTSVADTEYADMELRTSLLFTQKDVKDINYLDLFTELGDKPKIGECTPEYMLLPDEGIRLLVETIASSDRRLRVVLLVRNPVRRLLSALKMLRRGVRPDLDTEQFIRDGFVEYKKGTRNWVNKQDEFNDYASAIRAYKAHVPEFLAIRYDDFYENRLDLRLQLESFLQTDIPAETFNTCLDTRKNEMGSMDTVSDEAIQILRDRYSETQAFIDSYFEKECVL